MILNQHPVKGISVAVVGGGITGAIAAETLSKHFTDLVVFDQGRRGPGGRASHRSVDSKTQQVVVSATTNSASAYEFDHGCQFFRADTNAMKELTRRWQQQNWVAPWNGRFGSVVGGGGSTTSASKSAVVDFFGLPERKDEPVYIGVGGMHNVPQKILSGCDVRVESGTRVTNVKRNDDMGQWEVWGVSGNAAYHDTKVASKGSTKNGDGDDTSAVLATVDAVLLTDISSASESWHRASAGIPDELRNQIPKRPRVPLFSCMVALDRPLGDTLMPYDGFTVSASPESPLWFAARSQSKPGFPTNDANDDAECWTLVSTPKYACEQIAQTTMRDPKTGAFRPQENSYLNTVPGPALFDAFMDAVRLQNGNNNDANHDSLPKPVYLQAQRWGSGLPAPFKENQEVQDICGSMYTCDLPDSVVYPRIQGQASGDQKKEEDIDFIHDDALQLYYAGDFCSSRCPGFEASALSGLDVAKYMVETLTKDQ